MGGFNLVLFLDLHFAWRVLHLRSHTFYTSPCVFTNVNRIIYDSVVFASIAKLSVVAALLPIGVSAVPTVGIILSIIAIVGFLYVFILASHSMYSLAQTDTVDGFVGEQCRVNFTCRSTSDIKKSDIGAEYD